MPLYVGSTEKSRLFVGGTEKGKLYVGSTLKWSKVTPRVFAIRQDDHLIEVNVEDPPNSVDLGEVANLSNPRAMVVLADGTLIFNHRISSGVYGLVRAQLGALGSASVIGTGNDRITPTVLGSMGVLSTGQVVGIDSVADTWYDVDTTTPSDTVSRGSVPSGLGIAVGLAIDDNDDAYVVDDSGDELWLLNPSDPDSESGIYGEVEDLDSAINDPQSLVWLPDGRLLIANEVSGPFRDELWERATDGTYTHKGDLPAGSRVFGMGVFLA